MRQDKESLLGEPAALLARTINQKKLYPKGNCQKLQGNAESAKQKFPCNICKKLGHWAKECPERKGYRTIMDDDGVMSTKKPDGSKVKYPKFSA